MAARKGLEESKKKAIREIADKGPSPIQGQNFHFENIDESEETLKLATYVTGIGTFDWHPMDGTLHWSLRMHEIMDLDPGSDIDRNEYLFSHVHPEDKGRVRNSFQEFLDPTNESLQFFDQYRIVLDSGETKYVAIHGLGIRNSSGVATRLSGTCMDLTPMKKTEIELKESEIRFQQLANASSEGIAFSANGIVLDCNDQLLAITGYEIEEVIGKSITQFVPKEEVEKQAAAIKNKFPGPYTGNLLHKDGSLIPVELKGANSLFKGKEARVTIMIDLRERMAAEEALRKSEAMLSMIYNNTTDTMVLFSWNGKDLIFGSANDPFFELSKAFAHGYERGDIIGITAKYFFEHIAKYTEEDRNKIYAKLDICVQQKKQIAYVEESTHPGGRFFLENVLTPILDLEGEIKAVLYSGRNVTLQKEGEIALRESEERFEQFAIAATEGIVISFDGVIQEVNEQTTILLEYAREDMIGQPISEFIYEGDLEEVARKMKSNDPGPYEARGLRKSGTLIYTEIKTSRMKYKGEEALVSLLYDITERKKAEAQLKESEERLSLIYNSTKDLMGLAKIEEGPKFTYISANKPTYDALERDGIQISDYLNHEISEFVLKRIKMSKAEGELLIRQYTRTATEKVTTEFENKYSYKKGVETFIRTRLFPVLDNKGNCTHILWSNTDVSEMRKAERELKVAYEEVSLLKEQLEKENVYLQEELKLENNFEDMVFNSDEFMSILRSVEQVAPLDVSVLITGETGTGKELIARAIHNLSKRSNRPMIKVNCGALPKELVESELFGYEKGAFTGAVDSKPGKFELADGGTIFLDELGDMPLDAQVKLLRVLQEGELERLGGTKTRKINVRVLAATNRNLESEIEAKLFREDLYYRLNVFPIHIPSLSKRKADIPVLAEFFIRKFATKYNKQIKFIAQGSMAAMNKYGWPGNVREMENLIERAVITSTSDTLQIPELHLNSKIEKLGIESLQILQLSEVERVHIIKVLESCDWKITGNKGAAELLGLKPSTLRDRMKKLDILRPEQ